MVLVAWQPHTYTLHFSLCTGYRNKITEKDNVFISEL